MIMDNEGALNSPVFETAGNLTVVGNIFEGEK
jgi:hypothetical protein